MLQQVHATDGAVEAPLVVPSGPVEKIPSDGLQRTEDEAHARRREAVSEILCDMLMAAVRGCGDDPSLGEKVREP